MTLQHIVVVISCGGKEALSGLAGVLPPSHGPRLQAELCFLSLDVFIDLVYSLLSLPTLHSEEQVLGL